MISEIIEKWIKGILIDGITGNLSGLFDNVNAKVGEIASDVGSTPQAWNSGIFNMLRSLSETVVLPIAAAILALVMCHELIQMITEKNNMHDFDTSMFFRWIFKSAFAILIVSNTWNIVMGVFDATQSVVNQSSGVIIGETSIHFDRLIPGLEFQLESMTIGSLLSLWFQTLVVGLTMNILSICIFLVTYGRMIEIYVVTALGPIPLATMGSSEWRSTGQNYLKSLLALGFQAFLIMIVVGILIDRANEDKETSVHFLNQVDDADLLALLDEEPQDTEFCTCTVKCEAGSVNENCPLCEKRLRNCTAPEAVKTDTETPEEKPKSSIGSLMILLVLALAGGGAALYYFKFRKPKADTTGHDDLDEYVFGEDEDADEEPAEIEIHSEDGQEDET